MEIPKALEWLCAHRSQQEDRVTLHRLQPAQRVDHNREKGEQEGHEYFWKKADADPHNEKWTESYLRQDLDENQPWIESLLERSHISDQPSQRYTHHDSEQKAAQDFVDRDQRMPRHFRNGRGETLDNQHGRGQYISGEERAVCCPHPN